jgi:hypothetical protein
MGVRVSQKVTFRIVVRDPLPGVELRLQHGRAELVPPTTRSSNAATFEFELEAQPRGNDGVVFRGAAAQGPPASRFVYINAGTYAGQADSPWARRAKVPLTDVRGALVSKALGKPGALIVGAIDGHARDGGPAAATVELLDEGWRLELPE